MRWVRSLAPTLYLLSAFRVLFEGPGSWSPDGGTALLIASHGGSELPWWTPVAVSLGLVSAALVYWWRHRPRRPPAPDEPALPENGEPRVDVAGPPETGRGDGPADPRLGALPTPSF